MNKILATQCQDSDISILMDKMAYPHCVWKNGNKIKYARFYGNEWRFCGDTAVVVTSDSTPVISKHCIGIDNNENAFFVYRDGDNLKMAIWSGLQWNVEIIWSRMNELNPLAWSVTWVNYPVLIVLTKNYGNQTIWAIDKSSGNWGEPSGLSIPYQDNDSTTLKINKVALKAYAFWNGKNNNENTSWIGHAIWDSEFGQWIYNPEKKVQMSSNNMGDISGIDFATADELMSSSSQSSSSESSISSSSESSISSSSQSSQSSSSISSSSFSSVSSSSMSSTMGHLYWTESGGNVTITGYDGPYNTLVIPSTISSYPVTAIGNNAFNGRSNLTSVTIPSGVISIGDFAFRLCSGLTSITIPNTVTDIGSLAFQDCSNLTSISLGSGVATIGSAAFWGCSNLTIITIPNGVTNIQNSLFYNCANLASVNLGTGVTTIGSSSFSQCYSLANITIPSSVTSIGGFAFWNCVSLVGIYFDGNAPTASSSVFVGDSVATVYYHVAATGFTNPWKGRPTAIW